MNKFICTTTINPPSKAYIEFTKKRDWTLIIAGDKKTPHSTYKDFPGIYLSPEYQEERYKNLSDLIGWNCVQRRNFAFIEACSRGADIIATVDDDNIPFKYWGEHLLIGNKEFPHAHLPVYKGLDCFDPLYITEYKNLWHRGFPIQLVPKRKNYSCDYETITPSIQTDFWNGDPDVDAICRITLNPYCTFDDAMFPFSSEGCSVFNSQNTFLLREVVKDYFMFPHIGRMDDIWASFYVTSKDYRVIYNKATVFQDRNKQDLIENMKDEYIGYENNLDLVIALKKDPENIFKFLPKRSAKAFVEYKKIMRGII